MIRNHSFRRHMYRVGLLGAAVSLAFAAGNRPAAAQNASPAFGKLITASEAALNAGQIAAATRDVNAAAAMGNNAYEEFVVQQVRGAIAAKSGDYASAIASYTAQINSGRLDEGTSLRMVEAVAGMEMAAKNYAQAASWYDRYFAKGGSDPQARAAQIGAHYNAGDYAGAYAAQEKVVKAEIKAGSTPTENEFDMLYASALAQKDTASVTNTLQQMVIYYPKPQYWTALINGVINSDGFNADQLEYDTGLLQVATGTLTDSASYMTLVQTAIQGGHNGMALKLYNQATAANLFGTGTPAEIDRQGRLLKLINSNIADDKAKEAANEAAAAKDPSTAADLGYNLVDLDQSDKGVGLMVQGASAAASPDIANLRLGEAYAALGRKADAITAFTNVGGTNGAQGLAQLWILHLKQKS